MVVDSLLSHDDFSLILLHDRYPLLILGKLGTVRYEDFPPHVLKQIQEGKYHGGVLKRDDFDKGLYTRAHTRTRTRILDRIFPPCHISSDVCTGHENFDLTDFVNLEYCRLALLQDYHVLAIRCYQLLRSCSARLQ